MAKIRLKDGSYIVDVGFGTIVHAKDLKHAREMEKDTLKAFIIGALISLVIVIGVLLYGCP